MNILYLCKTDPRSPQGGSGESVRTYLLWKSLTKDHNVYSYVYGIPVRNAPISESAPAVFHKRKNFRHGVIFSLLFKAKEILEGLAILPTRNEIVDNPQNSFPNVKFDIVVARYLSTVCHYPVFKIAPLFVDFDDSPIESLKSVLKDVCPIYARPFAILFRKIQLRRIEKVMRGGWISNKSQISDIRGEISLLPNIPLPPTQLYNRYAKRSRYLFTVGGMGYAPNYLGVDKFLVDIWPAFYKTFPDIRYLIIGKDAPTSCVERWNKIPGVEYVGYVENLEKVYEECLASVVPIWTGSGTAIKTRESLAYSRVCISSPFGARGFEDDELFEGKNGLFIFNDAESFICAFMQISDAANRTKYEEAAFDYYKNNLSTDVFDEAVYSLIDNADNAVM